MEYSIRLTLLLGYKLLLNQVSEEDIDLVYGLRRTLRLILQDVFGLKEFELSFDFELGKLIITNITFKTGRHASQDELEQKFNDWFLELIERRRKLMDIVYGDYDDVERCALVEECLADTSPEQVGKNYDYLKRHTLLTEDGELSSPPFENQYVVYVNQVEVVENVFSGKHHLTRSENKGTKFVETNSKLNGVPYCFEAPDDLPEDIEFEPISSEEFDSAFREATHGGHALVFRGIVATAAFTGEPKRFYVQSVHTVTR
ncbi:TPA: hypothetical protein ACVO1K_003121 [Vibrio diabolicus]